MWIGDKLVPIDRAVQMFEEWLTEEADALTTACGDGYDLLPSTLALIFK